MSQKIVSALRALMGDHALQPQKREVLKLAIEYIEMQDRAILEMRELTEKLRRLVGSVE